MPARARLYGAVVMAAMDDYESLNETAHLLASPENARRLLASIDQLEKGGGTGSRPAAATTAADSHPSLPCLPETEENGWWRCASCGK